VKRNPPVLANFSSAILWVRKRVLVNELCNSHTSLHPLQVYYAQIPGRTLSAHISWDFAGLETLWMRLLN
jgi:hypothetical protein